MGIFRKEHTGELPPPLACCSIFYSRKGIVIASVHRDIRGWTPHGEPMRLLGVDANASTIGDAVLSSLLGSRDGIAENEGEADSSKMFRLMGEKSWKGVHKRWYLIKASMDRNKTTVEFFPTHRDKWGGWMTLQGDPAYRCSIDPIEMGKIIAKIISSPPLDEVANRDPSHT